MKPTISFYTLGCRLNQSETAVIQQTFREKGYVIVDFTTPADIVIINTCTVTAKGDSDTRKMVHKARRLNPAVRIALVGCQAQTQKDQLLSLPNVEWVVGTAKKIDIAAIIDDTGAPTCPQVITPSIPKTTFTMPFASIDADRTRVNLKVQDGCDFFCSFCEVPYARGRARSRDFHDIIEKAKIIAQTGHKELVITGVNIGCYTHTDRTLLDVIDALEDIPGIERIRLSSVEPTTVPLSLFTRMGKDRKLCRYMHIPLQHTADAILAAMNRKYTFKEFRDFLDHVHTMVEGICIGTDIIVGFPGETDDHFTETVDRLTKLPIDYFHVFSYSPRKLAKSNLLDTIVPIKTIARRSTTLRRLSNEKRQAFHTSMLKTIQPVLFEQKKAGRYSGLTDNYLRVSVTSADTITNHILPVRLDAMNAHTITGTLVTPHS